MASLVNSATPVSTIHANSAELALARFASCVLQSGVELNVVRSWLGHASIETTHAYMEIDMDMKRAALAATTPQADGISQPRWRQPDILAWLETL